MKDMHSRCKRNDTCEVPVISQTFRAPNLNTLASRLRSPRLTCSIKVKICAYCAPELVN